MSAIYFILLSFLLSESIETIRLSVPETWAKFSNNNIQRSQSERAASKNMRNEIESVINQCNNEMWQSWNSVNVTLNQRSQETTDARNRIQTHLSKVIIWKKRTYIYKKICPTYCSNNYLFSITFYQVKILIKITKLFLKRR